ncbi:MAG: flagellar hook-length control protein FliK [Pseudomonadota bacterium]
MEIDPRWSVSPAIRAGISPSPAGWSVGSILDALVVDDPGEGHVSLRIGGRTLIAETTLQLRRGDRLQLEVVATGPTPLLRPLVAQSAAAAPALETALMLASLPRQASLGGLLAQLAAIAHCPEDAGPVPPRVVQIARQLFDGMLDRRQALDSAALRTALADSGIWLEAKLAQALRDERAPAVSRDIKAGLLRLLQALPAPADPAQDAVVPRAREASAPAAMPLLPPLHAHRPGTQPRPPVPGGAQGSAEPSLGELRLAAESALARLHLQQLGSGATDGGEGMVWLLDLPIRDRQGADLWQLRIERRKESGGGREGAGDDRPLWSVSLAFELEELGPVYCQLGQDAAGLSVLFRAELPDTAARFRANLPGLTRALADAGVRVVRIDAVQGLPAKPVAGDRASILDARA